MKISKRQLKTIIKEEKARLLETMHSSASPDALRDDYAAGYHAGTDIPMQAAQDKLEDAVLEMLGSLLKGPMGYNEDEAAGLILSTVEEILGM